MLHLSPAAATVLFRALQQGAGWTSVPVQGVPQKVQERDAMTHNRLFIGIDPGQSGGIAIRDDNGLVETYAFTAMTERDIAELLSDLKARSDSPLAMVESVHSFPGQGVSSTFTFGQSYGFLRGLLAGLGIAFEQVSPGKWQKEMGCPVRGKGTKTEKKNATKARAQQLFPQVRLTHAVADALLIAEYARRVSK